MRALVMSGGPSSQADRTAILDYCQSDVTLICQEHFCAGRGSRDGTRRRANRRADAHAVKPQLARDSRGGARGPRRNCIPRVLSL
jgi:hypothetical protein